MVSCRSLYDVSKYKTFTTKLKIIEIEPYLDDDLDFFFESGAIKIKFKINSKYGFEQKFSNRNDSESELSQICQALGATLPQVLEKPDILKDKVFKAVIATRSNWNKAILVAALD